MRMKAHFLMIVAALSTSVICHAGYYAVSYTTNGVASFNALSGTSPISGSYAYTITSSGVSGGISCRDNKETATCVGSIQATFTWVPDNPSDLPPTSAFLVQAGSAGEGDTEGDDIETGKSDDGLGDTATDNGYGSYVSRTKYTVITNPGQSWSAPVVSPSATISQNGPLDEIQVWVTYSAALYPVWIDTTNTVNAGGLIYAEAGRQTGASLTCHAPSVTLSKYTWSVNGPTFKSYNPATASAKVVYLSAADLTQVSPSWYYSNQGMSYITCSAKYNAPDGSTGQVSAIKNLNLEKVEIAEESEFSEQSDYNQAFFYTATNPDVNLGGPTALVGMLYEATSTDSSLAPHFPAGGVTTDAQLVNLNWASGVIPYSTQGEYWLDNSFPYNTTGVINHTGSILYVDQDDSDSPRLPAIAPSSFYVSTVYDMYTLYKPSSPNAAYIPTTYFGWTWNGSSSDSFINIGGLVQAYYGSPSGGQPETTTVFPEWNQVFSNPLGATAKATPKRLTHLIHRH